MTWYFKRTEPGLWTVGFGEGSAWETDSDHGSPKEAADRVHWLNGGCADCEPAPAPRAHVATYAEGIGGWRAYCSECSDTAENYVWPCKLGFGKNMPEVLSAPKPKPVAEIVVESPTVSARMVDGERVGAVWGPSVEGAWFCQRLDLCGGEALRFDNRRSADLYLETEVPS